MQEDNPIALLDELGIYPFGLEEEFLDLEEKYSNINWHA